MTHFRNIILVLVAIFALAALIAAFQRRAEGSTAPPIVTLTVHDGAGRTHHVTGRWSSLVWDGATQTITLDVTTDSLFCGSFE